MSIATETITQFQIENGRSFPKRTSIGVPGSAATTHFDRCACAATGSASTTTMFVTKTKALPTTVVDLVTVYRTAAPPNATLVSSIFDNVITIVATEVFHYPLAQTTM